MREKLKPGTPAPDFEMRDISDHPVKLSDYKGKKLMLSFYRYASCPLCNLRVNDLIKNYEALSAKGLQMVAVFQSPTKSILRYVGKQEAPFPIVPDPDHKLYKQYGVEGSWMGYAKGLAKVGKVADALGRGFMPGKMEGDKNMVPADFLIDENGVIHTAYYGKDISDHLDLQTIQAFLA